MYLKGKTMKTSETNRVATIGGTGFFNLLFLTFLVLKLTHVIDWSWWWVTAPLWCPVAGLLVLIVLVLAGCALFGAFTHGQRTT